MIAECGVRNDAMRNAVATLAIALAFGAAVVSAAERTWTRSEILTISDAEIRRRGQNPEQMSVALGAFGFEESCGKFHSLEYWTVLYRPLNTMTIDADICVFIDRSTGEVTSSLPPA